MKISELWKYLAAILGAVVTIIVFLTTWIGFESHLTQIVDKRINDPEYIKKVADQVRPYLIFDGNGIIVTDGGALQYLDSIVVLEKEIFSGDSYYPRKMSIKPKTFLANDPIIQCIVNELFDIKISRTAPIGWIVQMSFSMGPIGDPQNLRFRLEIVR